MKFHLLGPVRAWQGSTEIELGSPQQRTTLAMLLLREGSVVALDDLITGMWGEEPPRSAVTTIRTYVSRLRSAFDRAGAAHETRLVSVNGGYILHTPRSGVDLFRFTGHTGRAVDAARRDDWWQAASERQAAVDLLTGQPLAGAFGPYVSRQRVRLEQLVTTARIDLLQSRINLGLHREVLPELIAMAAEHPLWEDVQALFMTALAGSGRVAEALEHYQRARRVLRTDLGIEPGMALRRAHREILAGNVTLSPVPAPVALLTRPRPESVTVLRRRHQVRLSRRRLVR